MSWKVKSEELEMALSLKVESPPTSHDARKRLSHHYSLEDSSKRTHSKSQAMSQ